MYVSMCVFNVCLILCICVCIVYMFVFLSRCPADLAKVDATTTDGGSCGC